MSDMTYGDLTGTTYGSLTSGTYDFQSTGSGSTVDPGGGSISDGSDTLLGIVQSILTKVTALESAVTALQDRMPASGTVATATDLTTLQTHGDATWSTATGFAVPGSAMTLTSAYNAAKTASQLTTSDIPTKAAIANTVWGRAVSDSTSRTLTASPSDVLNALSPLATTSNLQSLGTVITSSIPTADQIASAVWDDLLPEGTAGGLLAQASYGSTIWSIINSDIQPTLQNIYANYGPTSVADAVLDELLSEHTTAGSLGATISATATATSAAAISSTVTSIQTAVGTIDSTVANMGVTVAVINSNVSAISGYTDELEDMVENLPTASGIAQVVWGRDTGDTTSRSLTVSPTDVSGLATASSITALQTSVNAIPTQTYVIPTDYAKPGDAMTLTSAYNAAKTASQMTVADLNGISTAVQGVQLTANAIKAKTDNLPADPAGVSDVQLSTTTQTVDVSGLATAASVSALQNSVNAIPTTVPVVPTADQTATAVWAKSSRTLTASPVDITSLATASSITSLTTKVNTVDTIVDAIKAKTDNLPANPASVSDVHLSTTTQTVDVSGLATAASITALQSHGDTNWATATGFAVPSDVHINTTTQTVDVSGLATADAITALQTHGDSTWSTATGFAVPSDVQITVNADGIDVPTASENATAVWAAAARTLTTAFPSVSAIQSGLAKTSDLSPITAAVATVDNVVDAIKVKTDTIPTSPASSSDLTGLATASSISTLQASVDAIPTQTYTIPTDYAKPGDAMTLTNAYNAAKTAAQASDLNVTVSADGIDVPTTTQIADAVLDELLSGHTTAGSLGATIAATATATSATAINNTVEDIQSAVGTIQSTVSNMGVTVATINANVSAISGYTDELEAMVEDLPTSSGIASAVWSTGTRTLTASPTDISGITSGIAALRTSVAAIPTRTYTIPTDYAKPGDAMTLTSAYNAAKTASQLTVADLPAIDVSAVASATQVTALGSEVAAIKAKTDGLPATPASNADVLEVNTTLASVKGLLGKWSITGDILTTYDSDNAILHTYSLTRDSDNEVTSMTENA